MASKDGDGAQTGTVLVVEDSRALRGLLASYLSDEYGLAVVGVGTLAETQAQLAWNPERFFCAVLDLNLPDAPNGGVVDVVQNHGIPAIVLTGFMDPGVREAMLAKRVLDYFIKRNLSDIEQVAHTIGRLWRNRQIKVMVVDDSRSFRAYVQSLLDGHRYQILAAASGQEALDLLADHPDTSLVITDVNMPGMSGLELIETIRRQYRREDLAVIGMSDASKPGLSALLLKTGANDFIAKPFQVEELLCRVNQNTDMMDYVRRLREAATCDFLTGLLNRRQLLDVGEKLHANARRGHFLLGIGMVDADYFKRINDQYGHLVGDEALKVIASTLHTTLRTSDVVGRYGGEEFVCMAVLQSESDADRVFERACAAVAKIGFSNAGREIPLTVSIGFTTELGTSLHQMIECADSAVYQAKSGGRNRAVRWSAADAGR
ncbi:MAG: diguanylate cyclase [Candidatus Competibacteraceae bacterium]|nr:diguanylate cyclase [Candidatus Competibacteraceae bacterium]